MTGVTISGERFLINGVPTYPGRTFEGLPVEGLLFNVRAVQSTFDDANPVTAVNWVYPDTGVWDPERNVREFLDALPSWRDHGVLAFTLGFQGGGPKYAPEIYDHYINSAFTPRGELVPAYMDRISRVIARADDLGMVVIASFFYWKQTGHMDGEDAVWRAARNALAWLRATGRRNVVVEIACETNILFSLPIFGMENAAAMILELKKEFPEFLISTSTCNFDLQSGAGFPPARLVEACDFVLIHGNGTRPEFLGQVIDRIRAMPSFRKTPKPFVVNEDSTGMPNFETAWRRYVSWGYYDQGYNGEQRTHDIWVTDAAGKPRETRIEDLSGFQTIPVNWKINTARKRAFFGRVAQVTGRGV